MRGEEGEVHGVWGREVHGVWGRSVWGGNGREGNDTWRYLPSCFKSARCRECGGKRKLAACSVSRGALEVAAL